MRSGVREFLGHFLPLGSGGVFVYILPVLELFRWLVRPLTLGVRLRVNISRGHVLLLILGVFSSRLGLAVLRGLLGVFVLEFVVSYLQGYIYVSLLVLYSD